MKISKLSSFFLCSLLVIGVIGIALSYVASERYFYFWDYAMYQNLTISQVKTSLGSRLSPVRIAINSLSTDYNVLYTLPLIPVMRLIGQYQSRSTYVVSLALVYLLPYLLTIGLIAQQILPKQRHTVFWLMVMIALLTPAAWLPTWRGYPDTGAACLIALAAWSYLFDPDLKRWWQILVIGIALAGAPLFRRHFAYGVTAFLITVAFTTLVGFLNDLWRKHPGTIRVLLQRSLRLGLAGTVSLGVFLTLGRPFVWHVLSQNFRVLYTSWQTAPLRVFQSFRVYYGWLGLLLAGIGLIAGLLVYPEKRRNITFITLFGATSTAQWLFLVRQPNPQYSLHFTTTILLGLAVLAWIAWNKLRGAWRGLVIAALGIYLSVNAAFGVALQRFPNSPSLSMLLPSQTSPLRRSDYTEVIRLVNDLHTRAVHQEPISVIASSGVLNYDLLLGVDQTLYPAQPLNWIFTPEIDTRDQYPIESLLRASYVMIGKPIQLHLAPSEHEVLHTAYEAFTENWEISKDFTLLPETFSLMGGVQVTLYQRVRTTDPEVAIRTLAQIQKGVNPRPANQLDWIKLNNFSVGAIYESQGKYQLRTSLTTQTDTATTFLYLGNLPADGTLSGSGSINGVSNGEIHLKLAAANSDGSAFPIAETIIQTGKSQLFSIEFHSQEASYLLLTISSPAIPQNGGKVVLTAVEISSTK